MIPFGVYRIAKKTIWDKSMTDHELEQELLRDLESADHEKAELIKEIKTFQTMSWTISHVSGTTSKQNLGPILFNPVET